MVTTFPSGNVESPVVVMNGGAVMVTWPSVVSVIETGLEKVENGVSVTVVVVVERVPKPVGNFVTEAGEDWATGDGPFDTTTGTGELMLGSSGAFELVGEDSEGLFVVCGGTEVGGKGGSGFTTAGLDEVLELNVV